MPVPSGFGARPFAHRGLHDRGKGRPENSLSSFDEAIRHGYAIELDVQISADGEAMVFHDYELDRLTDRTGRVDALTADALGSIPLGGGDGETIPTLSATLSRIAGRVPLLIEIKDQTGGFREGDHALESRVCEVVKDSGHAGACAIMSFNPFAAAHCARALPEVPVGIVSYDFEHPHDAHVDDAHRRALADLAHFADAGACFVSYGAGSLPRPEVAALRERGIPIYCWTIRSAEEARAALAHSDQVTFEGYLP